MADAKTWVANLHAQLADTEAKVNRIQKAVVRSLHRRIVAKTPVVSGYLRSNWNVSVGSPDGSLNGPERQRPFISPEAATASAMRAVSAIDGLKLTDTAFISNGASYAGLVNDGGPRNSPHHMVDVALAEVMILLNAGRVPD